MTPVAPLVALPRAGWMNRCVRLLRGPDEHVDDMFAAAVDQRGNVLAVENVEAAADQWETVVGEILNRRNKGELAIEPRLHGVLVGRSDIGQMTGLQRADVGVDDFGGSHWRGNAAVAEAWHSEPGDGSNQENCGGGGQPTPGRNAKHHGRGCRSVERHANLLAQRNGRLFVKTDAPQRGTQRFFRPQRIGAFPAILEMALEFRGPRGVKLAVEVAVQNGAREITAHGKSPAGRKP